MKMVELNNGTKEPEILVASVYMTLSGIWRQGIGGMCLIIDFIDLCKDPEHSMDPEDKAKLKRLAMIEPDGNIRGTVKNTALSAAKGEGHEMTLISPIKLSEADHVLKEKVDQTIGSLIGVRVGMTQVIPTLSREQIEAFCDNTRNGSDLWDDFKVVRDASDNSDFGFSDYVRHVLSTTAHPMS